MTTPKIISCLEAKAKGLKHYFTGKACPQGHVGDRRVSTRSCVRCNNEATRRDYAKDPQKYRDRANKFRQENLKKCRARDHRRYAENTEKECLRQRNYRKKNPAKCLAGRRRWAKAHPEYGREWREANPEYAQQHRAKNRGMYVGYNARRRAAKKQATPPWSLLGLHKERIDDFYADSALFKRAFGLPFEVDHIRSLFNGGLHVFWNLQHLIQSLNASKGTQDDAFVYPLPVFDSVTLLDYKPEEPTCDR